MTYVYLPKNMSLVNACLPSLMPETSQHASVAMLYCQCCRLCYILSIYITPLVICCQNSLMPANLLALHLGTQLQSLIVYRAIHKLSLGTDTFEWCTSVKQALLRCQICVRQTPRILFGLCATKILLCKLYDWLTANKMSVNIEKICYMTFVIKLWTLEMHK